MNPAFANTSGQKSAGKPWQLLVMGAVMFAFFFARPLYLAHRDGSATFWEKGIFFTGVVLYIGAASLFIDVLGKSYERNAQGKERITRTGWISLLGAAGTGMLLLVLFNSTVHAMGLHDASEGPPLPRPTLALPLENGGK